MSHSLSDDEELNDMIGNILKKAEKKKSEKTSPKNEKRHSSDDKKETLRNSDPDCEYMTDYYKIIGATSTDS